jgi:hypothetical protein
MWRMFFREYLRAVSGMIPRIGPLEPLVNSEFDSFEDNEAFRKVFIKRAGVTTDYRKYDIRDAGIRISDDELKQLEAFNGVLRIGEDMLVFQPRSEWSFPSGGDE